MMMSSTEISAAGQPDKGGGGGSGERERDRERSQEWFLEPDLDVAQIPLARTSSIGPWCREAMKSSLSV